MPILLWYFPYIIFSGVCDLAFSTRACQDAHVRRPAIDFSQAPDYEDAARSKARAARCAVSALP
jgi:hypothetical protein